VDVLGGSGLELGSLVAIEEEFTLVLVFLGLGGFEKSGNLVLNWGLFLKISNSLLKSNLLGDLLALLTGGDSGVGVVEEGDELVLLLEVSVVSLDSDEGEGADGEGSDESQKSEGLGKILLVLLRRFCLGMAEHGEDASLASLLLLLVSHVAVGLLGKHSHCDVVVSTHGFGISDRLDTIEVVVHAVVGILGR